MVVVSELKIIDFNYFHFISHLCCIIVPRRKLANILNHSISISQTNQSFSYK